MKVLITGGTVFVSRYCAEYFVRQGHEVYVLNRNTRPQSSGVKLIECDRHCIGDRLKNHYFDVVMDITGYNERDVSDLVSALRLWKILFHQFQRGISGNGAAAVQGKPAMRREYPLGRLWDE